MFYDIFMGLCQRSGQAPTVVLKSLGMSTGNLGKWRGGRTPKADGLLKIAEHFGVEPVYLLTGKTQEELSRENELVAQRAFDEERTYWESVLLTDAVREIAPLLDQLNAEGQAKAIERISELVEVPKYRAVDV